jgi:hypothetical protein
VRDATEQYPGPVLRTLERLGLIVGSVTWDGSARIAGMTSFGEEVLSGLRQVDFSVATESQTTAP